jgi:excisionase family DNA binding protein
MQSGGILRLLILETGGRDMETYLTIEEVADYLKLTVQTIRRWVLCREIPFHKIKSVIRFRVSELEQWITEEGWKITATENGEQQGGLFGDDVISLEELAEKERAREEAETEGEE